MIKFVLKELEKLHFAPSRSFTIRSRAR